MWWIIRERNEGTSFDSMDIVTIKAQTLNYKAKNGNNYILNIIDNLDT